jgi:hypothetical protein
VRSGHDAPAPTSSGFETSSESESEPEEEEVDKPRWAAATAHRGTGRRPASASGTSRKESLPTPQPWGRRTSDRLSSAGTCRACSRARTPACRRTGRPCAGTGAATPCLLFAWPVASQAGGWIDPAARIDQDQDVLASACAMLSKAGPATDRIGSHAVFRQGRAPSTQHPAAAAAGYIMKFWRDHRFAPGQGPGRGRVGCPGGCRAGGAASNGTVAQPSAQLCCATAQLSVLWYCAVCCAVPSGRPPGPPPALGRETRHRQSELPPAAAASCPEASTVSCSSGTPEASTAEQLCLATAVGRHG